MPDENKSESANATAAVVEGSRQKRSSPTQILPNDRLSAERWQAAIRAYAVAHEANGGKPVKNEDAGSIINMAGATIVMTNAFLCDLRLLVRQKDDQGFVPSPELMAFYKAYEWNPETAGEKLRPVFERMWFSEVLVPRLKFRAYQTMEAVGVLAEACEASKDYERRLLLLLDLMEFAGVIAREGTLIKSPPVKSADNTTDWWTPPPSGQTGPVFAEEGHDTYTLILDAKSKRKVIVQAPHVISVKELERIRAWLGVQLIVEEEAERTLI